MTAEEKSDLIRFIRLEIERQANIILNGQAKDSGKDTESIDNMFPGMPTIETRPKVSPFGFASRAPNGTLSVVARVGAHAGSRYVIGHRDKLRPDLESGESAQYSTDGEQLLYLLRTFKDRVAAGKAGTFETLVAGETLVELLSALIDALTNHTHSFNYVPGDKPPTSGTTDAGPDLSSLKTDYLDNGKVLLKDGGRF